MWMRRFAMTVTSSEYRQVLTTVYRWSPSQRIALIQDLLGTLTFGLETPTPSIKTLDLALGLLSDDSPAPSDEEVEAWLDKHRHPDL
jgi:hypothetical protein